MFRSEREIERGTQLSSQLKVHHSHLRSFDGIFDLTLTTNQDPRNHLNTAQTCECSKMCNINPIHGNSHLLFCMLQSVIMPLIELACVLFFSCLSFGWSKISHRMTNQISNKDVKDERSLVENPSLLDTNAADFPSTVN
jgi:hypothetical protein